MKYFNGKCFPLEDNKSAMIFKITNSIVELGIPPLVRYSTLTSFDELEVEVSKLKDKWDIEFDSLKDFSKEKY